MQMQSYEMPDPVGANLENQAEALQEVLERSPRGSLAARRLLRCEVDGYFVCLASYDLFNTPPILIFVPGLSYPFAMIYLPLS